MLHQQQRAVDNDDANNKLVIEKAQHARDDAGGIFLFSGCFLTVLPSAHHHIAFLCTLCILTGRINKPGREAGGLAAAAGSGLELENSETTRQNRVAASLISVWHARARKWLSRRASRLLSLWAVASHATPLPGTLREQSPQSPLPAGSHSSRILHMVLQLPAVSRQPASAVSALNGSDSRFRPH